MLKTLALVLLIGSLVTISVSAIDGGFSPCHCDDEGLWSISNILECQKVSDFLIAVAYFSIPIELLCFVSFSDVPFKWVLLQFIAFIVLCGLTHLINGWTYYGPHSFQLMLALTISKLLTALVSCATAITLLTLIPLLLKWKVRENFLKQNVLELDQEVGMMKKQKEASWHVRMLTQEIRKSLDKHTILYTTLVELSKTLDLQNCAVWMPNANNAEIYLTHELKASSSRSYTSLPQNDPDVLKIRNNKGVRLLEPSSALGAASSGGLVETGVVAAIRMPMLRVSNFKGGTPELVKTSYAILVVVFPNANDRVWGKNEMEIVEVVADQVAVALSHAAVLEESQIMREKLEERNLVLQHAKESAMMASQARNSFQNVMSHDMRSPMHAILGLLSVFEDDYVSSEQSIIMDTMVRCSSVLSMLINDVLDISEKDDGRYPLEMRPFRLHSMIKEACCLIKCLFLYKGFNFATDFPESMPNLVIGDERRTFQVILHIVGHLLNVCNGGDSVMFQVVSERKDDSMNDKFHGIWRQNTSDEYVSIQFVIEISDSSSMSDGSASNIHARSRSHNSNEIKESLSFNMCKKLVQMMQGNIKLSSNSKGHAQSATLILRFQIQPATQRPIFEFGKSSAQPKMNSMFKGLRVILADNDGINRMVSKKLLEKLGCQVFPVSSGVECLSALGPHGSSFQAVVLDLHMPETDGFDVAMSIRKSGSRNWPLIVALTTNAEDQVWQKCIQVGINGVVRKPVLLHVLADELRRVLERANEGL